MPFDAVDIDFHCRYHDITLLLYIFSACRFRRVIGLFRHFDANAYIFATPLHALRHYLLPC